MGMMEIQTNCLNSYLLKKLVLSFNFPRGIRPLIIWKFRMLAIYIEPFPALGLYTVEFSRMLSTASKVLCGWHYCWWSYIWVAKAKEQRSIKGASCFESAKSCKLGTCFFFFFNFFFKKWSCFTFSFSGHFFLEVVYDTLHYILMPVLNTVLNLMIYLGWIEWDLIG